MFPRRTVIAAATWMVIGGLAQGAARPGASAEPEMVEIAAGSYVPLYGGGSSAAASPMVRVDGFVMDVHPVTNAEFLTFVRAHPEWRRSRVAPVFADAAYLSHWAGDLELGPGAPPSSPVVYVSWFAARAYLASHDKRLPTVDEWEYVALASDRARNGAGDREFKTRVLAWTGRPLPSPLPAVQHAARNAYGVRGLHDLVREWTEDFNAVLVTGESRADGSLDRSLFCGSGARGAADATDYAAFMRFAFRSSLRANYTIGHLGFRGVKPVGERRREPKDMSTAAGVSAAAGLSRRPLDVQTRSAGPASLYALDLALIDGDGRTRRLADLRGRPLVATMLYTSCVSVCPMVTTEMKQVERLLPDRLRDAVTFAVFSLDPGRDTPRALRAFGAAHGLDAKRWQLFATSPSGVRVLSAVLDVNYKPDAAGAIAHSAVIVVVDANGVIRFRQAGLNRDARPLIAALEQAAR